MPVRYTTLLFTSKTTEVLKKLSSKVLAMLKDTGHEYGIIFRRKNIYFYDGFKRMLLQIVVNKAIEIGLLIVSLLLIFLLYLSF